MLGYRPSLDGVRALAVLAVIGYHEGWARTPGGFLGVDIFLVLSGFLITYLLTAEVLQTGTVRRREFWARRARRLLPALFLLLIAVAIYALFAATAAEREVIRSDGLATLFYVQNWHLILQGDSYFAQFTTPSPFLHMWSLAIEEQWYLVWPLILLGLFRITRNRIAQVAMITGVLAMASAVLMIVLHSPGEDPSRIYFGTDTRAESLLVGALLAFLAHARPQLIRVLRWPWQVLGALGAVYLGVTIANVGETSTSLYRGGFSLVALAAAAVVFAAVMPGPVAVVLALPPLPAIGLISYGLYLWSWPVTVYVTESRTNLDGLALSALRIALTFLVATLSYVLVERPIRKQEWHIARIPAWAGLVGVGVVLMSLLLATSPLIDPRPATDLEQLAAALESPTTAPTGPPSTVATEQAPPVVLVAGDSVAFTLSAGFPKAAVGSKVVPTMVPQQGCALAAGLGVIGDEYQTHRDACDTRFATMEQAARRDHPDVAVLVPTAWDFFDREVDGRVVEFGTAAGEALLVEALESSRRALTVEGAQFVLMSAPCFGVFNEGPRVFGMNERAEPWRVEWLNEVFRRYADDHPDDVILADVQPVLCPNGEYSASVDGVLVRPDGVHFNHAGAALVWEWLVPIVRDAANS